MIYLLNGKAQSGKDTAFDIIKDYKQNCLRFAFADELKKVCKSLFLWEGEKDDVGRMLLINVGQILRNEVEFKEGKFWFDNRSYNSKDLIYRYFTILSIFNILNTTFIPTKDFWVDRVISKIHEINSADTTPTIVITDFRFKNEYYKMLTTFGRGNVKTVRIKRGDALSIDDRSETELDDFKFDYYIRNDGSLEEFKTNLIELLFSEKKRAI